MTIIKVGLKPLILSREAVTRLSIEEPLGGLDQTTVRKFLKDQLKDADILVKKNTKGTLPETSTPAGAKWSHAVDQLTKKQPVPDTFAGDGQSLASDWLIKLAEMAVDAKTNVLKQKKRALSNLNEQALNGDPQIEAMKERLQTAVKAQQNRLTTWQNRLASVQREYESRGYSSRHIQSINLDVEE